MPSTLPADLTTYLAWRFDAVLPGTFRRNKVDFAHHEYPILAPLPTGGRNTPPLERAAKGGPYVYFVCHAASLVRYVGKSLEEQVIQRWVRPGVGGPAKHYWTHSTRSGGAVFEIARGLASGKSPFFALRYVPVAELDEARRRRFGLQPGEEPARQAERAEQGLIRELLPDWNRS
ncbi:MAG: hypothetical protein KIT17_00610 [Rubrivivax sp.]|nr:hypothetical protein [Rubrivivax sp.]